jgi:hypothetical protein
MKKVMVTIMVALFATVVLGQTRTEVKPVNLPKCVTDYVTSAMKGYQVDKAWKIDNKGEITHSITIFKGKEKRTLIFDKTCKLVKNENISEPVSPKKGDAVPPNGNPPKDEKHPLPPVKSGGEQPAPAQPKK